MPGNVRVCGTVDAYAHLRTLTVDDGLPRGDGLGDELRARAVRLPDAGELALRVRVVGFHARHPDVGEQRRDVIGVRIAQFGRMT